MKKTKILIILLMSFIIIYPSSLEAARRTYGDLLDELAALKKEKQDKANKKALTEKEYNNVSTNIQETDNKINELDLQIQETIKKIEDLNVQINNKKSETKSILVFFQVSNGEKSYLEYIFKAKSFTDFIHRVSVVDELSRYNKELINEMNDLIKQNNILQEELEKQKNEEENERKTLKSQLNSLGTEINKLYNLGLDLDGEIEDLEEEVTKYKNRGCKKRSDILAICGKTTNIPYDTGFIRPVPGDMISSRYGIRKSPITGKIEGHTGIDIAVVGSKEGAPIYAAADGVVYKKYKVNCGGQMIVLHHNIKGQPYTTIYMHLLSFGDYDVGDVVSKYDIIAYMGGGPTTATKFGNPGSYDGCSTNTHLHFTIAKGHISLSGYRNYIVNPENYVYFPYRFSGRTW